jgi:MFS transporter, DHA3 family, macrolide efflux protein
MILARTASHAPTLAAVQAAMGVGAVAGAVLLAIWGGPRRRVYGVFVGMVAEGLLGTLPLGLGRSLAVWLPAAVVHAGVVPILNGANQAIWQTKVPAALQGRVFSARRVIAQLTSPLAMILAGPLIDRVLEPGMAPGGALAAVALSALARPRLRNLERDVPDAPALRDEQP